jgi:hypothetical protein
MLGAGQREKRQKIKNNFESTSMGCLRPLAPPIEPHLLSKTPIDGFVNTMLVPNDVRIRTLPRTYSAKEEPTWQKLI